MNEPKELKITDLQPRATLPSSAYATPLNSDRRKVAQLLIDTLIKAAWSEDQIGDAVLRSIPQTQVMGVITAGGFDASDARDAIRLISEQDHLRKRLAWLSRGTAAVVGLTTFPVGGIASTITFFLLAWLFLSVAVAIYCHMTMRGSYERRLVASALVNLFSSN